MKPYFGPWGLIEVFRLRQQRRQDWHRRKILGHRRKALNKILNFIWSWKKAKWWLGIILPFDILYSSFYHPYIRFWERFPSIKDHSLGGDSRTWDRFYFTPAPPRFLPESDRLFSVFHLLMFRFNLISMLDIDVIFDWLWFVNWGRSVSYKNLICPEGLLLLS